jgi:uncharacterized protein (TIGR03083 family)
MGEVGEVGHHYRTTRERVSGLLVELEPGDAQLAVPACPGWTVHDLVAHMTGVPDDALNGRLDGVATDPWTAAQVERGRAMSVPDLVTRWGEQGPVFEGFPLPPEAVIDLTTHEQDLRGALDRPGARDSDELLWAFALAADRATSGMPGLRIEAGGASYGPAEATAVLRGEPFEIFRALLGRRSADQLRGLDWEGGPPDDLGGLTRFGPAVADVLE